MITIVPFKAEHAYKIVNVVDAEFARQMEIHEKDETALTAMYGDDVFACGGVTTRWKGTGEVWTLNSPIVKDYPLLFHKLMLRWLETIRKYHGLRRIQAVVEADNDTYVKWIELLGFKREGLLRKYYDGKDFYMYAKVEE